MLTMTPSSQTLLDTSVGPPDLQQLDSRRARTRSGHYSLRASHAQSSKGMIQPSSPTRELTNSGPTTDPQYTNTKAAYAPLRRTRVQTA